uniref:BTB/POZ domain-containing protein DOT3 n=1 Tax=Rhizophora mucronata TaxID=61149 RepID=A0A2P2KIF0_RHIMU
MIFSCRSLNSQIPTDLIIQVQDVTFSVHKYPLVSKCGYISHLELQPSISNFGYELKLENFPGGSETFELILRFCYDLPLDLNPTNIAPLRCAAEFLEMSEEFEDGNLISKTEAFLTFIILSSWKDTISVLKSCETLSPWAENLQIVRRCSDSIAWKASTENSVNEEKINEEGWRFEDMATLRIDHFTRIMTAIKAKGAKAEITGKCIMHYAARWLPGTEVELEGLRGYGKNELHFRILCGRKEHEDIGHSNEQRTILESLISILPPQQEAVTCKFLLKMLRMAMVYSASPALISELEKRVGITLENANANDLLIPNYKIEDQGKMPKTPETMHNTDVVQRIIEYFLMHEQEQQQLQAMPGKFTVGKLLDNYLADIARDPNLSTSKFQVLAESLPENARTCDDGLYRAIDTYLKAHPSLSEHERKRLCKVMNCKKLSLDACMHAAQNDRLPLRTVIQVLLAEQVKVRLAMQGKEPKATASGNSLEQETKQPSTETEIMALKKELENVKTKIAELHRDYSELQHEYARLNNKQKNILGWSFGWKKIRESALFPRKVDADETEEEQRRSNPLNSQRSFRRRMSIS